MDIETKKKVSTAMWRSVIFWKFYWDFTGNTLYRLTVQTSKSSTDVDRKKLFSGIDHILIYKKYKTKDLRRTEVLSRLYYAIKTGNYLKNHYFTEITGMSSRSMLNENLYN